MKRYHEELHIIKSRIKEYQQLNNWRNPAMPEIPAGRYRKTLRCGGCGRARCQVCHSDKFPKRRLTRQEQQAKQDDRRRRFWFDNDVFSGGRNDT